MLIIKGCYPALATGVYPSALVLQHVAFPEKEPVGTLHPSVRPFLAGSL
jgi:hypothetical protein